MKQDATILVPNHEHATGDNIHRSSFVVRRFVNVGASPPVGADETWIMSPEFGRVHAPSHPIAHISPSPLL